MAENVADHLDDIAIERSQIRWRSLGAEAGRSMRLAVIVSALAGLIWLAAAKAADVDHVRSTAALPGRLSAAMLAGLLFQVACVTMQVSAGRYFQARSTRVDAPRKNGPLRLFGWALTAAPIAIACVVYWKAGMGLHRSGLTSRLEAPSGHAPMTAIRVLAVITWAAALVTVLLWWLTRSLVRRNLASPPRSRGAHRDPETIPYDGSRVQPIGGGTLPAERLHRDRRYARDTSKWAAGGERNDEPTEDIAAGRFLLVLSFSGGGLRSASFCLGGFRAVQLDSDRQQAVDAIVSVSGGSYAASALSMAASFDADGGRHQDDPIPVSDVYSLDSPELAYLRRNSRYLFQPSWRTMSGLWQLAAGAVLHILLVVAALRFASWLLGWFVQTVGLVPRLTTSDPGLDLTPHWAFPSLLGTAPWLLALIALGGLLVLQSLLRGERAEGGTATSPSAPWWARSVAGSGKVLAASLFALVLVPALFVGLGRVAYDGTGPDVVGRAIVNLGFTQDKACHGTHWSPRRPTRTST